MLSAKTGCADVKGAKRNISHYYHKRADAEGERKASVLWGVYTFEYENCCSLQSTPSRKGFLFGHQKNQLNSDVLLVSNPLSSKRHYKFTCARSGGVRRESEGREKGKLKYWHIVWTINKQGEGERKYLHFPYASAAALMFRNPPDTILIPCIWCLHTQL